MVTIKSGILTSNWMEIQNCSLEFILSIMEINMSLFLLF